MDQDDQIIEENEETAEPVLPDDNQAAALVSLEELIKNHIDSIDRNRIELKKLREQFEDSFVNNPAFRDRSEEVKEVTKARSQVRAQIAKQPSIMQLDQKIKDLRFDLAEQTKTMSDLLADYKEQTGATSIETHNGQVLEIISEMKLVRRSSKSSS
jgi:uncharacterized coiled-coil protein SlyX